MTLPTGTPPIAGTTLPTRTVLISPVHIVAGAIATRDWRPQHHDRQQCIEVYGLPDIIMNTPTQAGWIASYATMWSGPSGRVARIGFQMRRPIIPGLDLGFSGTIEAAQEGEACWWTRLAISLTDGDGIVRTEARVLMALPRAGGPQPWRLRGADFPVPSWDLAELREPFA